jgi:hypothetical protein
MHHQFAKTGRKHKLCLLNLTILLHDSLNQLYALFNKYATAFLGFVYARPVIWVNSPRN